MTPADPAESFPRRFARSARFTAGAPRGFTPSADRVAFLRAPTGTNRTTALWVLDLPSGTERLVADPVVLLSSGGEELTGVERSRRERMRESGAGITAFAVDDATRTATFALSSRLFVADLTGEAPVRELPAAGPVVDPRLSPDGAWVAYVSDGGLHLVGVDGAGARPLALPDGPTVTFGLAEFAAAEELDRYRGHWWSPASDALLVARVEVAAVQVLHIADPENPARPPAEHRYPAAGTANAVVGLAFVDLTGTHTAVTWDSALYEYLAAVDWSPHGPALLQVLSRRQDRAAVLAVDPVTGRTTVLRELADPDWVDLVPGTPAWSSDGGLLTVEVTADRYALCADGEPVSAPDLQVRRVQVAGDLVVVHATELGGSQHVHTWSAAGGWTPVTSEAGVHAASAGDGVLVVVSSTPETTGTSYTVHASGGSPGISVASHALDPGFTPAPALLTAGSRAIPTAVLLPVGWSPDDGPLPVLLDPYGGPHHARVVCAARGYLESQWWADQGFCVVVADGRGTPGTPSWERAVRLDLAGPPLQDQVDALQAVAAAHPQAVDLDRVAIRGWSFGGYLAALAVLTRPEVFHAAVAGAPVTRWELYDTAYTERYLGLPQEQPDAYTRGDLVALAPRLERPLMIIHGLADDNVLAANSLQLSSALLAAGRPHTFLPLSGVTHMTPQEVVAENLLLLQLGFLRSALGLG